MTWYARLGPDHSFWRRELIFESVRRDEFPDCPSRLPAVFAFGDLQFARRWRSDRPQEHIYLVEALVGRQHLADIAWTAGSSNGGDFSNGRLVAANARGYWFGAPYDYAGEVHLEVLASRGLILGAQVE